MHDERFFVPHSGENTPCRARAYIIALAVSQDMDHVKLVGPEGEVKPQRVEIYRRLIEKMHAFSQQPSTQPPAAFVFFCLLIRIRRPGARKNVRGFRERQHNSPHARPHPKRKTACPIRQTKRVGRGVRALPACMPNADGTAAAGATTARKN